jgi:hypothetical protein
LQRVLFSRRPPPAQNRLILAMAIQRQLVSSSRNSVSTPLFLIVEDKLKLGRLLPLWLK